MLTLHHCQYMTSVLFPYIMLNVNAVLLYTRMENFKWFSCFACVHMTLEYRWNCCIKICSTFFCCNFSYNIGISALLLELEGVIMIGFKKKLENGNGTTRYLFLDLPHSVHYTEFVECNPININNQKHGFSWFIIFVLLVQKHH